MKVLKKNIKAFTILEALIALVLTGIVVSSAVFVYFSITRTTRFSLERFQENSNKVLFISRLRKDVNDSDFILGQKDKIRLISGKNEIIYFVKNKQIYRFPSQAKKNNIFLEERIEDVQKTKNLIVSFNIVFYDNNGVYSFPVKKKYSNSVLWHKDQSR